MSEERADRAPRFAELARQRRLFERRRVRMGILAAGCVLIPLWQHSFARRPWALDIGFRHGASSGLQHRRDGEAPDYYPRRALSADGVPQGVQAPLPFLYFYHYLGLYPVATELDPDELDYSRDGARRLLATRGDTLVMEIGHTVRSAEPGQLLLYLPDVWLHGNVRAPRARIGHGMLFVLALLALYVACWAVRRPLLGILLVLLLGSNPFQLYEVYRHENVFGWMITTGILLLALHLPLLGPRRPRALALWAAPLAAGVVLATVRQVRPEPVALLASAGLCCLLVAGVRWRVRLALAAVLLVSFFGVSKAWECYFERLFDRAFATVKAAGGHPYTGPRQHYHMGWHSVWCGLGDFAQDRGYDWDDNVAKDYARPILEEKYGEIMPPWHTTTGTPIDEYWDDARKYYKMPHEVPHYATVVRDKVLSDIARDPAWYLGVLARRVGRIGARTTPLSASLGGERLSFAAHGALIVPVVLVLLVLRGWALLKLVLFLLPLSAPALLIYCDQGMCHYSCFHLVAAAVALCLLVEAALWAFSKIRHRLSERRGALPHDPNASRHAECEQQA